jgi:hypothetical protein
MRSSLWFLRAHRQKAMCRVLVVAITATASILFLTSSSIGQTAEQKTASEELKALQDPTILVRRIWLDSEWDKFKDGSSDLQHTLGGIWAWRMSDKQDWGIRLKVPFNRHSGPDDDATHGFDRQGIGDTEFAMGTAVRLSDTWRAGGGMQLHAPSGSSISSNTWRLQEFGAVAWDATPWLTFSPSFEHNHSVAEERGAPREHYLELYFPATLLMQRQWAVTAAYEPKIDFKNNDVWTHSIRLQLAKRLEEVPLGFSLSIKKPFSGEKNFQLNFVMTYYFSSK